MTGMRKSIERRKNKRYQPGENAIAAISSDSDKLGQIIDISMGGVCFKYIDTGIERRSTGTKEAEIIFLSSMAYSVKDLPVRTVGDYKIENLPSFTSMKLRKRHVQFVDLTVTQLFDLDHHLRQSVPGYVEKLFRL